MTGERIYTGGYFNVFEIVDSAHDFKRITHSSAPS